MKSNIFTSKFSPLVGLFLVLAIAFGCDIWIQSLKTENAFSFSLTEVIFLSYPITTGIVAGSILTLFWLLLNKFPRNKGIDITYFVVGVFIVSAFDVYYLVLSRFSNGHPQFIRIIPVILKPNTYLFLVGGFIGAMGLIMLLIPKTDQK
jgi:hypothetical protein